MEKPYPVGSRMSRREAPSWNRWKMFFFGMQAQQHVHVGQSQVGVQKQHTLAARRQGQGQIDRDIGLAHAPLPEVTENTRG